MHKKKHNRRYRKQMWRNTKRARRNKKYAKRQQKRRRQRSSSHNRNRKDNKHHLLWCKKDWQVRPYARALRELPYFQKKINQYQVHNLIHEKLSGIPVPSETECQKAFERVMYLRNRRRITKNDSPERMLTILIKIWKKDRANILTVAALEEQRRLIRKWSKKKWRP